MLGTRTYTLVQNEDEDDTEKITPIGRDSCSWVIPISVTTVVVCVFVNICLVVLLSSNARLDLESLRDYGTQPEIHSTYIGLDRLYANKTAFKKYPPIRNQAKRFFQISSAQPTRQLAMEAPKVVGPTGYIPSAHGFYQLLITPEVSTLVEFRAIDYGMENCNLVLNIPSSNTSEQTMVVSEAKLELWSVGKPNTRIDRKTLSWNTRPRRSRLIASAPIYYGTTQTFESFRCPSGMHFTFELACNGCYLNFTRTSDKVHDVLYLAQSQTLT